jgi:drug/metabolite transporter (DMT)-like permease
MVDSPYTPAAAEAAPERRPLVGYALVWAAVALWSLNATVAKIVLESADLSALRLSEVRATGAALLLFGAVAVLRPRSLRASPRELAFLAVFGVAGLAFVQLFYFVAIERLAIGIALVIQYLTPVFVALWARFVAKEPVRRRIWGAIALSLAGLSLVVNLWGGVTLDGLGVAACLAAAVTYAAYVLMAEGSLRRGRDTYSLLAWGFLFAAVFWAIVQPWWTFPTATVDGDASLLGRLATHEAPVFLLLAYVVVLGTVVPFILLVTALHYIRATRVTVVAMLEPVLAALVAFAWLGEELTTVQMIGAALVLVGVGIAQTARPVAGRGP